MMSALLKASRSAVVATVLAAPEHAGQRFDRHAEKQGDNGENEDDLDQGEAARTTAARAIQRMDFHGMSNAGDSEIKTAASISRSKSRNSQAD